MSHHLSNRILLYSGDSVYTPEQLNQVLKSGGVIDPTHMYVSTLDNDIKKFNTISEDEIKVIDDIESNDVPKGLPFWDIPEQYQKLDIKKYLYSQLLQQGESEEFNFSNEDINNRIDRIESEYELFERSGLTQSLNAVKYIVDSLSDMNIVWGTGRGSSCASYILYLLGLHDVDSVEYEIDINEFFRNETDGDN